MKSTFKILFVSALLLMHCIVYGQNERFSSIAPTPPMGWNSYNCFGGNVTEQEVKANADYMAENLKQYGWEYVVVDFLWYCDDMNTPKNMANRRPNQYIDQYGRLIPSIKLHPSSINGNGLKPLGDYIHNKGLKFGIHIMRGIPHQAVDRNTPIKNCNSSRASNIANLHDTCLWYGGLTGINMTKIGSQEYYNSLFELYAQWGVDFIKVDDISYPYHADEIEAVHKAIQNCGRPMVLSLSPGPAFIGNPKHLSEHANMWRISKDFWDNWTQLKEQFEYARIWAGHSTPGHYPDFDMLSLGKLAKRSELQGNQERFTKFTKDEQYTHISLWAIFGSPLMFGGNLPDNDQFTLSLLTNRQILKVNQKGINSRELKREGNTIIWVSDFPESNELNVAFFNLGNTKTLISISWQDLGIEGKYSVADLWEKKELSISDGTFTETINPHGAKVFTLTPENAR